MCVCEREIEGRLCRPSPGLSMLTKWECPGDEARVGWCYWVIMHDKPLYIGHSRSGNFLPKVNLSFRAQKLKQS